jgi:hypothetical protein
MLTRRALLTGGVMSGAAAGTAGAEAQSGRGSGDADERLVKVVEEVRDLMRAADGGNAPELAQVRLLQKEFFKGRGKFPDFIEVGIDVWDTVVNWHIRTRQQPQVARMGDGRYAMALFQSNLVLRHDVSNSYIGQPFDGK